MNRYSVDIEFRGKTKMTVEVDTEKEAAEEAEEFFDSFDLSPNDITHVQAVKVVFLGETTDLSDRCPLTIEMFQADA